MDLTALYDTYERMLPKNTRLLKSCSRSCFTPIGRKENMRYDKENDCYICFNGKTVKKTGSRKAKTASGYVIEVTSYHCSECDGCLNIVFFVADE